MFGSISGLCFVPSIYLSVLMRALHSFKYEVLSLEVRKCKSATLFFLNIALDILGPLHFHVNFEAVCQLFSFLFLFLVRTFKYYSLSKFQLYNCLSIS